MSLHEKGDQTRALNHNSNLQTVFVWTFQIRKRLRISLPKFVEETFYPSENPVRFRRRFKTGIFGLLYLSAGGRAVFIGRASGTGRPFLPQCLFLLFDSRFGDLLEREVDVVP